jgi:antibiotic biosynthesis monooxygenase (ABM) superfamily enzyme
MRPGNEEAYGPWAARVIAAAQEDERFISAVGLDQAGALHHLVFQFADAAALKRWSEQEPYATLAFEADAFSVGLDQNDSGAIMGFDLPSEVAAKK